MLKKTTLFLCYLLLTLPATQAKVIHQERSLYRNILVEDEGDLRCLKFNVKSTTSQQSCFLQSHPEQLFFNYTKLLMTSLIFNPQPKRILIIGLGGGTMSNALTQLYPKSDIDNVDIDPAVIKVAREYFGFVENDNVKTYTQDGRIFIKRALLKKQHYDWVILDAFNGDYIPSHLMTAEFLQEAKRLLSDDGILSANTFWLSKLYDHESATYQSVFGDFYHVANNVNSNRIIIVRKKGFSETFIQNSFSDTNINKLSQSLSLYGVDIPLLYPSIINTKFNQNWPKNTRILTDQYSPANLLNAK